MLEPPRSLWWDSLPAPVVARARLDRDLDVDVAIVGGGFTGLWTARELLARDPALRVAVIEQSVCGFGASGRNGGWASALFPVAADAVIERYGRDAYDHVRRVLQDAVVALGQAAANEGIDAHFVRGGALTFARSEIHRARLIAEVDHARSLGVTESDLVWLDEAAVKDRGVVAQSLGATYTPHCARIHPARLVRGLADAVAAKGASVFEDTHVTRIVPASRSARAKVLTLGATVSADVVVRATEGFTSRLPGYRRDLAPIYSLMIATAPLPAAFWDEVGFGGYETFADDRHLIIYGQRTSDDRIAFGGRGAPYHFASTVETRFDHNQRVFALLESTLRELFPTLDAPVTHTWGGPLAMPRDLSPSVAFDRSRGIAVAGGYTGDGVVLSYVAANALADVIATPDVATEFSQLCFVQRHSKRWEVEPLRWMGINAGLALATHADYTERTKGREGAAGRLVDRLFSQTPH